MERKIKNFKHCTCFQASFRNPHVDDESNDSEKNVGEKSKIHAVTTPGAQMAKKALKTLDNNNGVRKSTRVKYPIQRLTYDGLLLIIMHTW
jgi:hypothetical protein